MKKIVFLFSWLIFNHCYAAIFGYLYLPTNSIAEAQQQITESLDHGIVLQPPASSDPSDAMRNFWNFLRAPQTLAESDYFILYPPHFLTGAPRRSALNGVVYEVAMDTSFFSLLNLFLHFQPGLTAHNDPGRLIWAMVDRLPVQLFGEGGIFAERSPAVFGLEPSRRTIQGTLIANARIYQNGRLVEVHQNRAYQAPAAEYDDSAAYDFNPTQEVLDSNLETVQTMAAELPQPPQRRWLAVLASLFCGGVKITHLRLAKSALESRLLSPEALRDTGDSTCANPRVETVAQYNFDFRRSRNNIASAMLLLD